MIKIASTILLYVNILACTSKPEVPVNVSPSETSKKYVECVMSERERLYRNKGAKTENEIIGEVQSLCNSKVLKIK